MVTNNKEVDKSFTFYVKYYTIKPTFVEKIKNEYFLFEGRIAILVTVNLIFFIKKGKRKW